MKKLMVAIAAVASAFGLYAAGFAPHKVTFTGLSDGTYNITGDAHWGYSGTAEDLQIKSEKLEIKTGSNALSRYFIDNENASVIPENGLFFDTTIDFKDQALDEVPTIDAGAKLGLFILDASQIDGILPNYATTNLYLVGGYGNGGKALYQLTTIINPAFYESPHRVTIKAYNSALSTGARAGFMIYLDGQGSTTATPVDARYVYVADNDGKFNLNNPVDVMTGSYLGDVTVAPALSGWAKNYQLFLSINANSDQTLASVDFTGNAILDYVDMTNTAYDFIPADASAMSVSVGDGVTLNPEDVVGAIYDGVDTITVPTGVEQFTIKPTFTKEIKTVTVGTTPVSPVDGVYTINFIKDGTITISQADAAAYVTLSDGSKTAYPTFDAAFTEAKKNAGAVLTLNEAVNKALEFDGGKAIVLDLAGQTITAGGNDDGKGVICVSTGALTITNSVPTAGGVVATAEGGIAVNNVAEDSATVAIYGGKFDGFVQNFSEEETPAYDGISVFGGRFSKCPDGAKKPEGYEWAQDEDDYWYLKEMVTYAVTWTKPDHVALIVATVDGTPINSGDEFEPDTEVKFTVTAAQYYGYDPENPPTGWEIFDPDNTIVIGAFTVGNEDLTVTIPEPVGKRYVINYKWYNNDEQGAMMDPLIPNDLPDSFVYGETVEFKPEMITAKQPTVETATITPKLQDPINGYVQVEITFKKGPTYPSDWPETNEETKQKYITWAADKTLSGDKTTDQKAFLLNCNPTAQAVAAEEAAFTITEIKQVEGEWVVTAKSTNKAGADFNGEVVKKAYDAPADGKEVEPTGDETELFWKAFIVFPEAD